MSTILIDREGHIYINWISLRRISYISTPSDHTGNLFQQRSVHIESDEQVVGTAQTGVHQKFHANTSFQQPE